MAPQPTNQETLDRVLELISLRTNTYQTGVQTTICWKSDSGWLNAITKLEFIRKGEEPPSEIRHEYSKVEINRRHLTQTEFVHVLKQLVDRNLLETSSGGRGLAYESRFSSGGKTRQP
ncbi:MAG TPA: hypothetical protein VEH86_01745, partial [Candidatus Acidoferrum sp.]|nr:hypothetical protein [Candidatus Acidoferrum sp.]